MDTLYERLQDDLELLEKPPEKGQSQIRNFYVGQTVFLTGSTGFVGKCLVEKLLRGCPELERLYILVRPKKQIQVEERMKKYFQNIIFERLHKINPDFQKKVVPVHGDLEKPGLGLSPEDRQELINNANIIIHNGATVIFEPKISIALKTNVLGTKEMLDLAIECKNIKAFLYISTAFSHCYMKYIEDKFYPIPVDLKLVEDVIKADSETEGGISTEAVLGIRGDWPNTYTFTKAIAESIVEKYGTRVNFPCAVFRPSIVSETYREPIQSWCGNANGPTLVFIGCGLGVIHASYSKYPLVDAIPADMTINGILAAIWDLAVYKKDTKTAHMYNYTSSILNPVTLDDFERYTIPDGMEHPSMKVIWAYFVIKTKCFVYFLILHVLFHFFPACIMDIILMCQGKKPVAVSTFFKVNKQLGWMVHFANGNWRMETTQMLEVWDRMNLADKEQFYSDLRTLNWPDFFRTFWPGIRVYLLNDPMSTLEAARKKYRRLERIHYTIATILGLLLLYFVYSMVCRVFGL